MCDRFFGLDQVGAELEGPFGTDVSRGLQLQSLWRKLLQL